MYPCLMITVFWDILSIFSLGFPWHECVGEGVRKSVLVRTQNYIYPHIYTFGNVYTSFQNKN